MKSLLRSVFLAESKDDEGLFLQNYHALSSSGLGFDVHEDNIIWEYVQGFFKDYGHLASLQTIRAHFEQKDELGVVDRIERLAVNKPRTRGDFISHLEAKAEERRVRTVIELAKEMATIATQGIEIKERHKTQKLRGAVDAVRHILEKSHDLVAPTLGAKLSGDIMTDGDDFKKDYELIESDPKYGIGQYCGIRQIDETLRGAKKSELWIHAGFTGHMKCLTGETEIWDVKSGKLRTLEEIYLSKDLPEVHGISEEGRIVSAPVSGVTFQGVRQTLKIQTRFGKTIEATGNHPFLTPKGWVNAESLKKDDWVAIPRSLPNNIQPSLRDEELIILGYLLGDGCLSNDICLSNGNPKVIQHFISCLESIGYQDSCQATFAPHFTVSQRENHQTVRVSRLKKGPLASPVRLLLEKLNLFGTKAQTKFVPSEIWNSSDQQIAKFIGALWATDGHIGVEKHLSRSWRPSIWIVLKSFQLSKHIMQLLLRLGIPSSIKESKVKYQGETRIFWRVQLRTNPGFQKFLETIPVTGKEEACEEARKALNDLPESTDPWPSQFLADVEDSLRIRTRTGSWYYAKWAKQKTRVDKLFIERFAEASADAQLIKNSLQDVFWEQVSSIEACGEKPTYDLCVPQTKNFVANGFITHNSSWCLQWAYIQAVYYGFSSVYFSLEMPYRQVRNVIYTMHSAHEDFAAIRQQLGIEGLGLDYEKVKNGWLQPNEKKFLFEYVVPDMNGKSTVDHSGPFSMKAENYGHVKIEVADPDKTEFSLLDLKSKSELIYAKTPFNMIFVDHAGLMSSRNRYSSTTERLNEVVRDLKKLAMSFNRGMGMAIVGLFQLSREGFKQAEKNGGRYNLTALSYANECERSADIVTCSWIDPELRKMNRIIFQCLKSRDQKPFDRIPARVEYSCRRIITDNTPIEQVDDLVKDAREGNQEEKKYKKKHKHGAPDFEDIED